MEPIHELLMEIEADDLFEGGHYIINHAQGFVTFARFYDRVPSLTIFVARHALPMLPR